MSSFGQKLKSKRESLGKTLSEIADSTKIRRSYLEALEQNDFEAFPGKAYGKFFLRAYAEAVGFNPDPLMVDYDRAAAGQDLDEPATTEDVSTDAPTTAHPWKQKLTETRDLARTTRLESRRSDTPETVADRDPEHLDPISDAAATDLKTQSAIEDPADLVPRDLGERDRSGVSSESSDLDAGSVATGEDVDTDTAMDIEPDSDRQAEVAALSDSDTRRDATLEESILQSSTAPRSATKWVVMAVVVVAASLGGVAWLRGLERPATPTPRREADLASAPAAAVAAESIESIETELSSTIKTDAEDDTAARTAATDKAGVGVSADARTVPDIAAVTETPAVSSELNVVEFGVGHAVVNRQLSDPADRFAEGSTAVFFTRVVDGTSGQTLRHVWWRGGGKVQTIELEIGSSNWRTYSRKTLWGLGSWRVEAVDAAGRVLATSEFECVAKDPLSR